MRAGDRRDRGADPASRDPRPSPRCSSSRCRTRAAASSRPPGYFQRVREICDRYGVLLVSDEVICAFGRLGHMFGVRALRLPARHDHVREGPDERLLAARRGDLPRASWPSRSSRARASFLHGITFGGHPVSCAVALANLELFERGGPPRARAAQRGRSSASGIEGAARHPDRRRRPRRRLLPRRSSSSRTRRRRRASPSRRARSCCAGSSRPRLFEAGLICRTDDRGDPVVQLVAAADRRARASSTRSRRSCAPCLTEAWKRIAHGDVDRRSVTRTLTVGVPREVKEGEHRVAITPDGVHELVDARRAPCSSSATPVSTPSITDDEYRAAGAEIVADAPPTCGRAPSWSCKVKEPQDEELGYLRPGLVALHLPAPRRVPRRSPTRCSSTGSPASRTRRCSRPTGALPLLAPMSEVAGRMAHADRRPLPRTRARRPRRAARRRRRACARRASSCSARATSVGTRRGSRRAWRPRSSCSTRTSTGSAGSTRSTRAGS